MGLGQSVGTRRMGAVLWLTMAVAIGRFLARRLPDVWAAIGTVTIAVAVIALASVTVKAFRGWRRSAKAR